MLQHRAPHEVGHVGARLREIGRVPTPITDEIEITVETFRVAKPMEGGAVYGGNGCPAFTEYGIECLKQIIIEERALLAQAKPQRVVPAVLAGRLHLEYHHPRPSYGTMRWQQ